MIMWEFVEMGIYLVGISFISAAMKFPRLLPHPNAQSQRY